MKILIVDDNSNDRKLLRYNLQRHGCAEIIEGCDGAEGYEQARTHRPDIIISDALMPRVDGFELLRRLKMDDELKGIPFIFHSSVYTGVKDEELALRLGAEAFIPKPAEPEVFWQELSAIFERVFAAPKSPPVLLPVEEEKAYLREHYEIVAAKLEEKVQELEESLARIKAAEEELLKLSAAIEQSPVTIIITDAQGRIEYVNPKFTELTGYLPEEALGRNPRILKSGETPADDYQSLWATISAGKVWRGELHNRKKDGELFWEAATISPVHNRSGEITHYIAIKEDITEQRKLEAQLRQSQKMEAIGLLAGGIAHDFNNMLMAISGYGGLLQMKMAEDDPLRPNVDKILQASDRAAGLTRGLLTFSRKQEANLQPANLNEIVKAVEKFLDRVIGEEISLQLTSRVDPLPVHVDSGQIEQVLMNLVTNGRDAMLHGGTLTITTEATEIDSDYIHLHGYGEAGKYALISVTDCGIGMDASTVQRIFDPFFTTKEIGKGTGLGLSIVYGIVKQHKGYIDVISTPGEGTTFQVYLPLRSAPGEVGAGLPQGDLARGTETILLAEDESELRRLVAEILTEFGYSVIEAVNGEEAVARFREHRGAIDLLLFDLVMPIQNGKLACQEIREIGGAPPVIFMSGYSQEITRKNGLLAEEDELIMKPVSPQTLLRKIREVLDRRKKVGNDPHG